MNALTTAEIRSNAAQVLVAARRKASGRSALELARNSVASNITRTVSDGLTASALEIGAWRLLDRAASLADRMA